MTRRPDSGSLLSPADARRGDKERALHNINNRQKKVVPIELGMSRTSAVGGVGDAGLPSIIENNTPKTPDVQL